MTYDLIIIGMGISGISAAIYAKNSGLNVLMLEKSTPGGITNKINNIKNYPGIPEISGPDLSLQLFETVNKLNIPYKITKAINITMENDLKKIETTNGTFTSKYIILAIGRQNRRLGLPHEEELLGHGISTCALCDGALYKNKVIAVVGGGNSALDESLYLSNLVNKIYLIHRRDTFRAEESLIEKIKTKENIEIIYNSNITELIKEDNKLTGIIINENQKLEIAALFVYIGFETNNELVKNLKLTDTLGYIEVDKNYETKIPGIYAVGDCINKEIYQLITAANEGASSAIHIIKQMNNNKINTDKLGNKK